jgi:Flp pilus assembly CpaF family ATPase
MTDALSRLKASRRTSIQRVEAESSIRLPFGDFRAENVLAALARGAYQSDEALASLLRQRLLEVLPPEYISPLSTSPDRDATVRLALRELLQENAGQLGVPITEEVIDCYYGLTVGLGPLQLFVSDPTITDIRVGDDGVVFVAVLGGPWERTAVRLSAEESERVARQIAELRGEPLGEGEARKAVDFPDGSRFILHAPPRSPLYRIIARRRGERTLTLDDMVANGSMSEDVRSFLVDAIVTHHCNAVVAGPMGSGKTALVTALIDALPAEEAPAIVQDVAEIVTKHPGAMRLYFTRSEYDLAMADCLRMRPTRIIVGEALGEEMFLILELMNTGGGGHMTTGHGESPQTVLTRLAGAALRHPNARSLVQVVDLYVRVGVDLVVFLDIQGGQRVVSSIDEVDWVPGAQVEPFVYPLRNVWRYAGHSHWEAGPAMQEHTAKVQAKLGMDWTAPKAATARYQLREAVAERMREAHQLMAVRKYGEAAAHLEGVQHTYPSEVRGPEVVRLLEVARARARAEAEARQEEEANLWRAVMTNIDAAETAAYALGRLCDLSADAGAIAERLLHVLGSMQRMDALESLQKALRLELAQEVAKRKEGSDARS